MGKKRGILRGMGEIWKRAWEKGRGIFRENLRSDELGGRKREGEIRWYRPILIRGYVCVCVCVFVRECVCVSLGVIYSGQKIERERERDKIESKRDKEKREKRILPSSYFTIFTNVSLFKIE